MKVYGARSYQDLQKFSTAEDECGTEAQKHNRRREIHTQARQDEKKIIKEQLEAAQEEISDDNEFSNEL